MTSLQRAMAMFVLCLALVGCLERGTPQQHEILSVTTSAAAAEAGRVGVLPFFSSDTVGKTTAVMSENMAASLRELGLHEVVLISPEQRDRLIPRDVLLANRMRAEDLLAIRDQLHVDAILIGRIEHFDSFDPISLGVTTTIVSCHDGEVLWATTGHFDGHRQDIQTEIRHWYDQNVSGDSHPLSGWKVALESPRMFTRYVTDRLTQSIPLPKP